MKLFIAFLFGIFLVPMARAETMNLNWIVDGNTYAQTSCEYGDDLILPTAPTKYGYTFHGWAGYTFLEYIESTGGQYISTNISGEAIWTLVAQTVTTSSSSNQILIARGTSGNVWFGALSNGYWGVGGNNYSNVSNKTKANISVTFYNNGISAVVNGSTCNRIGAVSTENNYQILAYDNSYYYKGKLFGASCEQNGGVVLNLIPARRNADGEIGLYDTVTQTFLTNSGTGTFIAGPEL